MTRRTGPVASEGVGSAGVGSALVPERLGGGKGAFRQLTAQDVSVNVGNGLPRRFAGIEYQTELSVTVSVGKGLCNLHHLDEEPGISVSQLTHGGVLLCFRENEQMHQSLRRDIGDREDSLVVKHHSGGDLTAHDTREDSGFSHAAIVNGESVHRALFAMHRQSAPALPVEELHQRPNRTESTAMAAGPAVEVRNTP